MLFSIQPSYGVRSIRVENRIYSLIYFPEIQPTYGIDNNMFNPEQEDPDDPDYLTEKELKEIEASLRDYSEGRFKHGSLEDLLRDLEDKL